MERGLHVYVQKPLTYTVREGRVLNGLAHDNPRLVTQMGNQGHSGDDGRRVVEMIRGVLEEHLELSGSVDEIIRGIVGSYVDWVAEHPQLHDMAERELGDGEPGELERAIDVLGEELSELLQAGAALLGNDLDDDLTAMLDLLVVGLIGQVRGAVNQWVRRPERSPSARTLTRLLSRWIWYQIDGQARELGVVVDPARPLAPCLSARSV